MPSNLSDVNLQGIIKEVKDIIPSVSSRTDETLIAFIFGLMFSGTDSICKISGFFELEFRTFFLRKDIGKFILRNHIKILNDSYLILFNLNFRGEARQR